MVINSWKAFIIYSSVMFVGFVFTAYKVTAPYQIFALYSTLGFSSYIAKRLIQKANLFNNKLGGK